MFWPFVLVASVAIGFIQLGALSVWVSVLSLALKFVLLIALVSILIYLCYRYGSTGK